MSVYIAACLPFYEAGPSLSDVLESPACIRAIKIAASLAYLHFILRVAPYLYITKGNGRQAKVKNAGMELAQ